MSLYAVEQSVRSLFLEDAPVSQDPSALDEWLSSYDLTQEERDALQALYHRIRNNPTGLPEHEGPTASPIVMDVWV